jgi:hypothetical protein
MSSCRMYRTGIGFGELQVVFETETRPKAKLSAMLGVDAEYCRLRDEVRDSYTETRGENRKSTRRYSAGGTRGTKQLAKNFPASSLTPQLSRVRTGRHSRFDCMCLYTKPTSVAFDRSGSTKWGWFSRALSRTHASERRTTTERAVIRIVAHFVARLIAFPGYVCWHVILTTYNGPGLFAPPTRTPNACHHSGGTPL